MSKPNAAGNAHDYELCVIFDGSLDDKKAGVLLEKYLDVLKTDGGSVTKIDPWGRKTFAYEINKKNEGIYFVVYFNSTAATKDEFTRRLGLDELTVRYKVFRDESK